MADEDKPEHEIDLKYEKNKQIDLKEKSYSTRQVETSVALLASPETEVVLEALLFISKYADFNRNNLLALIKTDIIEKLFENFHKNICILRVSLRLLSVMLDTEDAICEMDQEKYDPQIVEISQMYIDSKDQHVKQFCVEILAKIANSCRITTLIFKTDLFNPIFDNMKAAKDTNILYYTMLLFYELIDAPAAVTMLSECPKFDLSIIMSDLNHKEERISNMALDIVEKLSRYGLTFLQESFRKLSLVEKMFKIIMDDEKTNQHSIAIRVIHNCLNSEETCSYFVESLEFLELCQWVKICHPKFLLPIIEVFIKLTSIPELKQTLFDLSVEESILYFYRFKNKSVINKTCEAVSNMTTHKYCCEAMLTPVIAGTLIEILENQTDEEDPFNEVVLKTVFHFIRRYYKAMDIFLSKNFKIILLDYFFGKVHVIKEESFLMILEILYRCMAHPVYQQEFMNEQILNEVLKWFQSNCVKAASLCCEIMTNILTLDDFRKFFFQKSGPQIFLNILKSAEDINLITQILYFIFACFVYENLAMAFLHNGLLAALKNYNELIFEKIPICKRLFIMALEFYPPIKFYETGRMEITDKLPNKFYLINGQWHGSFPFLEVLEMLYVSPYPTIYLIDYSYEVVKTPNLQGFSQSSLKSSKSSSKSLSTLSVPSAPSVFNINYGQITRDIFLPRYIYHLKKFEQVMEGPMEKRICFLAEYVDTLLSGPTAKLTAPQKIHEYKLHIQCLKKKLGNNIIPIGFLRLGFHCERALLFKALADKICIPCSLVKGSLRIYWNEVALFENVDNETRIRFYVVDLMHDLGNLMLVGSREANKYCNIN
ncbi:unnamed protein product [Ceutorhynchus assimilis]|uniref:EDR1/CTR1/ARMC3-like peptidase-like domain-containing protein n=1 Tax=Ceutorhynchus assimilis TaxID=467358 RepID=A0A9N9MJ22_9CUCU|nr:unnamed protein product [Ceutorhynchus assimilis]